MNKTVKLALFLAVVSAISGLVIGFVNDITAPIIEQRAAEIERANLEVIFPGGDFVAVNYEDEEEIVIDVYKVENQGYIFKANAKGYSSSQKIVALIGLDLDGRVIDFIPLEQAETSGVGSKCFEQANINQMYIGKNVNEKIDVLTGATFTSKAIRTMIQRSQEIYSTIK